MNVAVCVWLGFPRRRLLLSRRGRVHRQPDALWERALSQLPGQFPLRVRDGLHAPRWQEWDCLCRSVYTYCLSNPLTLHSYKVSNPKRIVFLNFTLSLYMVVVLLFLEVQFYKPVEHLPSLLNENKWIVLSLYFIIFDGFRFTVKEALSIIQFETVTWAV